jgi:hypothetical protein
MGAEVMLKTSADSNDADTIILTGKHLSQLVDKRLAFTIESPP